MSSGEAEGWSFSQAACLTINKIASKLPPKPFPQSGWWMVNGWNGTALAYRADYRLSQGGGRLQSVEVYYMYVCQGLSCKVSSWFTPIYPRGILSLVSAIAVLRDVRGDKRAISRHARSMTSAKGWSALEVPIVECDADFLSLRRSAGSAL